VVTVVAVVVAVVAVDAVDVASNPAIGISKRAETRCGVCPHRVFFII
jgi:hypothetical protein